MNIFIQVIEVWKLARRGSRLELECGMYGDLEEFRWQSERTGFEYGEGLPGRAWQQREPLIMTKLEEPYFQRAVEARRARLSAAIALPVFIGDFLGGVVVLLCGDGMAGGALEVWAPDDDNGVLSLRDGHYGALASLGESSRELRFAEGEGLPGLAMVRRAPVLMSPISDDPNFKRAQAVGEVEVTTGVALPTVNDGKVSSVAVMLSAQHTPIARSFELWKPDPISGGLRVEESYETTPEFNRATKGIDVRPAEGILGRAWVSGCPMICEDLTREDSRYAHWACMEGLHSACAIPFNVEGRLKSILMLAM